MDDDFARVEPRRHVTKERGHGRQEHRSYYALLIAEGLPDASRAGLKQVGLAIYQTMRGGKSCDDVRCFIQERG